MLTNEEKKMLKVVAAYNDTTEEVAKQLIVKRFLGFLVEDPESPMSNMKLPDVPLSVKCADAIKEAGKLIKDETPAEKPKRKYTRKTVNQFASEVEAKEREGKMTKDEFVAYFGGEKYGLGKN